MNRIGLRLNRMGLPQLVLLVIIGLAVFLGGCTQSRNAATQSWSGVAVSDDSVYVGTREGQLIQLSVDGGIARIGAFHAPEPDQGEGFPAFYGTPAVANGRVYAGTYNGVLISLDAASFGDARTFEIEGNDLSKGIAGAVVPEGSALVVAATEDADEGRLYVLEADSLIERCRYPARNEAPAGQIWSTPTVYQGVAYFGDFSKQVHAVSIADCRPVWEQPTTLGGAIVSPFLIVRGKLYTGTFDRSYYEIDLNTGSASKLFEGGRWFWARSATDGQRIYAPNMDGNIYAYDLSSNRVIWTYPGGKGNEPILAEPVVVDGELVYASDSGVMVVLDALSGNRLWDRKIANDVRAPITTNGRLVFLHALDETVSAVDLETKQLAWERNLSDVR